MKLGHDQKSWGHWRHSGAFNCSLTISLYHHLWNVTGKNYAQDIIKDKTQRLYRNASHSITRCGMYILYVKYRRELHICSKESTYVVRFVEPSWNHRGWGRVAGCGGRGVMASYDIPYLKGKNRDWGGNLKSCRIRMQVYFTKANGKKRWCRLFPRTLHAHFPAPL